ncbi:Structural maintenance of chromosomes protein 2 [Neolecta irregularis DAH-3]|uniref:Structural maintenance of chromosomes protein 2 n=1 Tax=Neolecta irregularis (strain DAH-3) TaxID=1198029 RepID=A0A1U7LGF3_NEOID|nr:Structural maintenance of chromosomes protein 2 [Neolecta irregularis DAH-3]|eukprot:OLL21736.1 Structural maintenance of chromosomes protein 2 [Neolecta irregularis DAH-3]
MRIEELIIDGFKSYAVRTVIANWDSAFNAITVLLTPLISRALTQSQGLNGSGKSNILDSICFVLGITNMSTMRAANLQDLIYKRGQAGVTKASVTIVFDNKDTKNSPIGFEEYSQISVTRQVVMGGQSKYLINGHRAQQHTVQNLFQSVQLNINNPNFLIMQGKITKVLNMKPVEILAMIEEAAGTRMFEDRKDKAFKTMAKKDKKVEEINALLAEEIEPKLEKLRNEKRAFLEFQQTQSDLERLTKVVIAHDYLKFQDRLNRSGADLDEKKNRILAIEENMSQKKNEISHIERDVRRVNQEREKEAKKGGRFQALETKVKETSHELVRINTVVELKESTIAEEQDRIQKIREAIRLVCSMPY